MSNFKPSKFQKRIFDFVVNGEGNAVIEAVAGSGKTTTVVEALKLTKGEAIFLAFNKSIATELAARVPANTKARTFHSLCFSPVLRVVGALEVTPEKIKKLIKLNLKDEEAFIYTPFITRLVSLARQSGIGCLMDDKENNWYDIVDHHELVIDSELGDVATGIRYARDILTLSNNSSMVDFDDLLYFAVLKGIRLPTFNWVFVDEAQDTNAIQRAILRKILAPSGRLVAVGDPAQAIYGFRGADSQSLNMIAQDFDAVTLPLSVSYRCSKAVVEYARKWVNHIEPSETAPEGEVMELGNWTSDMFRYNDLVVCRNTADLISLCYKLMGDNVGCKIMGKEIGEGLIKLIKRMKAVNVDDLDVRLGEYMEREVQKAIVKDDEQAAEAVQDKVAAIRTVIRNLDEDERTIEHLIEVLGSLFDAKQGVLTLSTIHKAKGLEADRVWWLNHHKCPSKWAKQPWQKEQERNLCYVAATRAKTTLFLIQGDNAK